MSELNQGSEQNTQNSINETGGIPEIEVTLEVSGMTQTPVDKSLSISDMAADAKVTGDRFANVESDIFRIEGDISELNAKTGEDIPITGETGALSIAYVVAGDESRITALENLTGSDVPITGETGASSIADVVGSIQDDINTMKFNNTGATIPITGETGASSIADVVAGDESRITALENRTGSDVPITGETGASSVADVVHGAVARIEALESNTGSEIPLTGETGSDTIANVVSGAVARIETLESRTGEDIPVTGATGATSIAGNLESLNETVAEHNTLLGSAVYSVNTITPVNGDVTIRNVATADNLTSSKTQDSVGEYIIRTSGGEAPLDSGDAYLLRIKGNQNHTGYIAEELYLVEHNIPRTGDEEEIVASINRDTFVSVVSTSQNPMTFHYTTAWDYDLATYGITIVSGEPIAGDTIDVFYTKENLGLITIANPTSFRSTGWNLYNHSTGYARVIKYSNTHGFRIGGTYTSISFATSASATEWQTITPENSLFTIPSDGYIAVEGGNDTDTYIIYTWSDWTNGPLPAGNFQAYTETAVDLSTVMDNYFPYGLGRLGDVYDEINLNLGAAYSRIGRLENNSTNLTAVQAAGVAYDADTNYIYYVKPVSASEPLEPVTTYTNFTLSGAYQADDHGNEYIIGITLPVQVDTMYGNNLKNKLETNVVTVSQQTLNDSQKEQVLENIGAAALTDVGRTIFSGVNVFKNISELSAFASTFSTGQSFACRITSSGGDICSKLFRSSGQNGGLLFGMKSSGDKFYYHIFNDQTLAYGAVTISTNTLTYLNEVNTRVSRDAYIYDTTSSTTHTVYVPSNSRHMVVVCGTGVTRNAEFFVYSTSGGVLTFDEINKGTNVSFSTPSNNHLTITFDSAMSMTLRSINVYGGAILANNP